MGYNKKYDTYRPTELKHQKAMSKYKKENKLATKSNVSEGWMLGYLNDLSKSHGIKFKSQMVRGTRIYDFWCNALGIAIEVDGGYHNEPWKADKDKKYDKYNYEVSGIIVIRVKPFDLGDMYEAIEFVKKSDPRPVRRRKMGLSVEGEASYVADKHLEKEKQMQSMWEEICDK